MSSVRSDGVVNLITGLGTPFDSSSHTQFRYEETSVPELDNLYSLGGLAARVVDSLPNEATQPGFRVTGDDTGEVQERLDDIATNQKLCELWKYARAYGGAVILVLVNDTNEFEKPIDYSTASKIKGFDVFDRSVVDLNITQQGLNKIAQITLPPSRGSGILRVSYDRLIIAQSFDLPQRVLDNHGGFSYSVLDRSIKDAIIGLDSSYGYSEGILHLANAFILTIQEGEWKSHCDENGAVTGSFQKMLGDLYQALNTWNILGIPDTFQVSQIQASFTGLKEVVEMFRQRYVQVTDMPRTKALGEQPSGLNATADAEMQSWNSYKESARESWLRPKLQRILDIQSQIDGRSYGVEFNPLALKSDREKLEEKGLQASADATDISSGVKTPEQVRIERGYQKAPVTFEVDISNVGKAPPAENIEPGDQPVGAPPSIEEAPSDLLGVREAAQKLNVPTRTITRLLEQGSLRYWQLGKRRQVSMSELLGATRIDPENS